MPLVDIPVLAVKATVWSGALLVMISVPLVVIGEPLTVIPVPAVAATEVTVPPASATKLTLVPSLCKFLPLAPVWLGSKALIAACAVT